MLSIHSIAIHSMNDDIDDASASIPDKKCGAYHENYRMIPWSYDSMTSRHSLPQLSIHWTAMHCYSN